MHVYIIFHDITTNISASVEQMQCGKVDDFKSTFFEEKKLCTSKIVSQYVFTFYSSASAN